MRYLFLLIFLLGSWQQRIGAQSVPLAPPSNTYSAEALLNWTHQQQDQMEYMKNQLIAFDGELNGFLGFVAGSFVDPILRPDFINVGVAFQYQQALMPTLQNFLQVYEMDLSFRHMNIEENLDDVVWDDITQAEIDINKSICQHAFEQIQSDTQTLLTALGTVVTSPSRAQTLANIVGLRVHTYVLLANWDFYLRHLGHLEAHLAHVYATEMAQNVRAQQEASLAQLDLVADLDQGIQTQQAILQNELRGRVNRSVAQLGTFIDEQHVLLQKLQDALK